jgi:hypothetical protein
MTNTTTLNHAFVSQLIAVLEAEAMRHDTRLANAEFDAEFTDKAFDLSTWTHPCGAPACIAGHAVWLHFWNMFKGEQRQEELTRNVFANFRNDNIFEWQAKGSQFLGITYDQGDTLFVPTTYNMFTHDETDFINMKSAAAYAEGDYSFDSNSFRLAITPRMAAKVLRHLLETNEVDWTIVRDEFVAANPSWLEGYNVPA